jgi:murein DD-endopeptidase MepM/ murein hydrolase activator NlpD
VKTCRKLLSALVAARVLRTGRANLWTALAAAAVASAALAVPASAQERTLVITFVDGRQATIVVDAPASTPVEEIVLPELDGIVLSVAEVPAGTATPTATATATAGATVEPTPTPTATPTATATADAGAAQERARRAARRAAARAKARAERAAARARAEAAAQQAQAARERASRRRDGRPTADNPTYTQADVGAAPIGVPNFFIDKFRIPPFLLPIYQAAGMQYGVRWEVLAAINEIETDYGRNLRVSSAGAQGWMQFMPATWKAYGVDANEDGVKDPYNPADAIFAAARYLRAAGAETDLGRAIYAYNHADWYVDQVVLRARVIGGLPSNLVGSLTGLTEGRFPVHAKATYADDLSERDLRGRRARGENAAFTVQSSADRRGIRIYARRGAPAVAVNDGRVVRIGTTKRLGRFVQLQDAYGNTYTYAHLARIARTYAAPKARRLSQAEIARELALPARDPAPTEAASTTDRAARKTSKAERRAASRAPAATGPTKVRLFANPQRPRAAAAGGARQLLDETGVSGFNVTGSVARAIAESGDVELKALRRGAQVPSGTILGRIGRTSSTAAPHLLFEIRPAGRGAPRVDPKPILDGWKLLESTAFYRAANRNPFYGSDAAQPSIGQILLMSKETLAERVAANPRIQLYECGRRDVRTGEIDRRVLATLEYLAASGLRPTVTSLKCGHSFYTASGSVSHHSSGNAVDIAAINGVPILGHQGKGSITELAVQRLLTLQGTLKPDQIITLMTFSGADNTFAMSDHHDHIHVGWRPLYGTNAKAAKQVNAILKPKQWIKLIDRLSAIDNPKVRLKPSKAAVEVTRRASRSHRGE